MRISDSVPAVLPEDVYAKSSGTGNTELEHSELRYLFQGILSQLPAEQKEVIALRFGEELEVQGDCKSLRMQPIYGEIPLPSSNGKTEKGDAGG